MQPAPDDRGFLTSVSTVLTPSERLRVDAAGEGLYTALHRESVEDVIRDLKERGASAVIVSVSRLSRRETVSRVARMVREFPRIPAVALLTQIEPQTAQTVLTLGHSGVHRLIDVRHPSGWNELRTVLTADRVGGIQRLALSNLTTDLAGAPVDCWQFFEALFGCAAHVSTVRLLSRQLDVLPSTLMSRFFRASLPAPKRYLTMARLTRAASMFENAGLSVANVANHLDYSSPQSFGRHVRTVLGVTAVEFRQRYDGEGMLHRFREEMVIPHLPTLRRFRPLTNPAGWTPRSG
jgi:AraC-like DNA-binding protein